MELQILRDEYQVVKLKPEDSIPKEIWNEEIYSITRTDEELSIVAKSSVCIESNMIENNWRMIKIVGMLDFALIGILSKISMILANAGVSIFALSTYNTDYVLIKADKLPIAKKALQENGYTFRE